MEWIGDAISEQRVREQRFDVECEGRRVPGILWMPADATEIGAVALLGHGGSLHKRADYILGTARRLVRRHAISAIAIDGPGHGDRRPDGGLDPEQAGKEFESAWSTPETTDQIVADWVAALDAVQAELGEGPVGYFGLSMGTMMGVPVIAAEPARARCGSRADGSLGTEPRAPCSRTPRRYSARSTSSPSGTTRSSPRNTALELFDQLGTRKKSLHAHPGKHVQVPPGEMRAVPDFLATHLL